MGCTTSMAQIKTLTPSPPLSPLLQPIQSSYSARMLPVGNRPRRNAQHLLDVKVWESLQVESRLNAVVTSTLIFLTIVSGWWKFGTMPYYTSILLAGFQFVFSCQLQRPSSRPSFELLEESTLIALFSVSIFLTVWWLGSFCSIFLDKQTFRLSPVWFFIRINITPESDPAEIVEILSDGSFWLVSTVPCLFSVLSTILWTRSSSKLFELIRAFRRTNSGRTEQQPDDLQASDLTPQGRANLLQAIKEMKAHSPDEDDDDVCIICLGLFADKVATKAKKEDGKETMKGFKVQPKSSNISREVDPEAGLGPKQLTYCSCGANGVNFHQKCLQQWTKRSSKCPICRSELFLFDECVAALGDSIGSSADSDASNDS
jgi:hypothetical protein